MKQREKIQVHKSGIRFTATAMLLCLLITVLSFPVHAADSTVDVVGKVYTFPDDNDYEITTSQDWKSSDSGAKTYGLFSVKGNLIKGTTQKDVPAYMTDDKGLTISYTYDDSLLNAEDPKLQLVADSGKVVDGKKLNQNINHGTLILQTSFDHLNWSDAVVRTDLFKEDPNSEDSFYTTKDIELLNGCYYRLTVAYETRIRIDSSKNPFKNHFLYEKHAEVYEFYAYTEDTLKNTIPQIKSTLGERTVVEDFDGYYGSKEISTDDPHYGWELGNFFISSRPEEKKHNGNPVFLKKQGDQLMLWFHLNQDINKLDGNPDLLITPDHKGQDKYFETPLMDMGRGTLIIRFIDHENVKHDPIIYTNYLEANTSVDADTRVYLFEEGDYEVALDYEIHNNKFGGKTRHYRIPFSFSVRNSNCMVFPVELSTEKDLISGSITENGFRLDLAKSRYLDINVKKETREGSASGLVEDVKFNHTAMDGQTYTDEGIYTITVKNRYTDQETQKVIYVGTDRFMKAHMLSGYSLDELNDLVAQGAKIDEGGNITMPVPETVPPTEAENAPETTTELESSEAQAAAPVVVPVSAESASEVPADTSEDTSALSGNNTIVYVLPVAFIVLLLAVVYFVGKRKQRRNQK